jgi:hypothetical protein
VSVGRWPALLAALVLPLATLAASGGESEMRVRLESDTVRLDETVRLVLEIPVRWGSAGPDLSPLSADFQVLGSSLGRETWFESGQMRALTRWLVELAPRRSGRFTIPSFQISRFRSAPRTVTVLAPRTPATGTGAPDLVLELEVTPRSPYARAQATLTLRLLHAVELLRGALPDPAPKNGVAMRLGEDTRATTIREGRSYQVVQRRYALFARSPGEMLIPTLTFAGVVDDGVSSPSDVGRLFGRGKRVSVSAGERRIAVRGPPAAAGGGPWLPAATVELGEQWSHDPLALVAGEAVTRTITLSAVGLRGEQLPKLALEEVAGAVSYPDRPTVHTTRDDRWVRGRLSQRVVMMPEGPGELELPAVRVQWWDTAADSVRDAIIPARTVRVAPASELLPASPGATAAARALDGDPARPWQIASAVLALLWLATLAAWWRLHRRAAGAPEPGALRRLRAELRLACAANDAPRARDALLARAALTWPEGAPATLGALAQRLAQPAITPEIMRLDRALYAADGQWSGAELWRRADRAFATLRVREAPAGGSPLPDLHPGFDTGFAPPDDRARAERRAGVARSSSRL